MTILLLSGDEEAVDVLQAALGRLGLPVETAATVQDARVQRATRPPLVLIVDTAVAEYEHLQQSFAKEAPWMRVCIIADPTRDPVLDGTLVVPKPFDAMELAALVGHERRSAELDQSRHLLLQQTDQLTHERVGLERELEHAERLAALGRIAAGMAHEINNPLAVIHASADYIGEVAAASDDPDLQICVDDMRLAIERISVFVQHVCTFARRERPQLVEATLAEAVSMALRMVSPRARQKKVRIERESIPEILVPHDPPRLAQALMNLLSNAIDATHGHGRLVRIHGDSCDESVALFIDDDGTGLFCQDASELFEPFATTKPPGEGTGLGLAIARRILTDHGGSVALENRPSGGARAICRLPLLDPAHHLVAIVEPDAAVRRALQGDLKREGFSVISGETFDDLSMRDGSRAASVVICDPGPLPQSAQQALAEVSTRFDSARALFVTGAQLPSTVHPRVSKPWRRDQLVSSVRQQCVARTAERARRSIPPAPLLESLVR